MTDARSNESATASCPFDLDLRDPHTRADALAIYARLRERESLAAAIVRTGADDERDFTGTLGRETLLATDYDDTLETLTDDRFSIDGLAVKTPAERAELPPVPDAFRPLLRNLLSLDPPDHTRLRRLVQPSWTPRALEHFRPRVQAIADELIDEAERAAADRGESAPNRTVELVNAFAYPLPMTVISEMLGVPREDRAQVRAWSEALIESEILNEAGEAVLVEFTAYLEELFAQKRRQPTDDMTTYLVQAEEAGEKLDNEELLSMVFILIVAGHVTTVNLIGSAVLALLNHPEQLARLKANSELAPNAVEETLRFWGPVEMASPRYARENMMLDGVEIARGEAVFPVLAAANRDPARFADPDHYDIARPDANRHVAFGKGVHLCLGAPLARIEGQVAIETLMRRWPEMRLAEPLAEAPLHQNLFRGPERLLLTF